MHCPQRVSVCGSTRQNPRQTAKFTARQDAGIRRIHDSGDCTIREIAGIVTTTQPTIYRSLARTQSAAATVAAPAEPDHSDTDASGDSAVSVAIGADRMSTALRSVRDRWTTVPRPGRGWERVAGWSAQPGAVCPQ